MQFFSIPARAHLPLACAAGLLVASCGPQQAAVSPQTKLPISINEVMASLINHSADPIWIAAWRSPQGDDDWRELEHLARQLQVGGALLTIPGSGPADETWTSSDGWRDYANQLSSAAGRAVEAAQLRNVQLISQSGDEIVDICESCHIDFKPDVPTMKIYGELKPTETDFQ
ncbi:MAG: hypothetical protein RL120_14250 [Gammaproteobacteria bacterium]